MIFNRKAILAVTCSAGVFFRAAAAAEGKSTKGTKSQSNPIPTLYFLNPSSCPQDCVQCVRRRLVVDVDILAAPAPPIDGHSTGEAVQPCDAENIHQMWRFHQKDGLTMIESEYNPGDCLAVVPPQEADVGLGAAAGSISSMFDAASMTFTMAMNGELSGFLMGGTGDGWVVDDMCQHGSVGLLPCTDPAAQWISNGANWISALCWKNGISSFLTVNEGCSELSVMAADGGNDALLRSQTFLLTEKDFIETIVPAPTDEGEQGDLDHSLGVITRPDDGWLGGEVGSLMVPDQDSGPVVPAECDPTCENGEVCAKHSPTQPGGKCYTECEDDINGAKCDTQGAKCVQSYSDETGITSDCNCETDGKEGNVWMCRAY